MYYQTSGDPATATATVQSVTNGVATITADLTGAINGGSVSLVYPATLHNDMGGINETALLNQNGNLTGANGISTKFDAAIGTSTITLIDGWNASVSDMVTMISSVGRAFEWHSKGQEFDSPMLHKKSSADLPGFFCAK